MCDSTGQQLMFEIWILGAKQNEDWTFWTYLLNIFSTHLARSLSDFVFLAKNLTISHSRFSFIQGIYMVDRLN